VAHRFPAVCLGLVLAGAQPPHQAYHRRTPDIQYDRRGLEIQQWLNEAPARYQELQIRRFAALDDEVEPLHAVLPAESVFACDPWHGLTGETADRVIHHLQS